MTPSDDGGYVTPAFIGTVALTLLLLVGAANLLATHYARGVLQLAVEEGARQGLAAGDPAACAARVRAVIDGGLGAMRDGVAEPACGVDTTGATAAVQATFPPWVPGVPAVTTSVDARVTGRTAP